MWKYYHCGIEISVRASNVLHGLLGIKRFGKRSSLKMIKKQNVLSLKNCGKRTFDEINALVMKICGREMPDGLNLKLFPSKRSWELKNNKKAKRIYRDFVERKRCVTCGHFLRSV